MSTDDKDREVTGISEENVPAEAMEGGDLAAKLNALRAERDQLATEKAELHDRLLRRQAEFENFRRRTERDRSEFVQYAGMELVQELLPILDDFERALKVESADRTYVKGIELIYQRLFEVLRKQGLEAKDTTGKMFDPHEHQAVEMVQTDAVPDHSILEEFQKGYNFKGKLLRPSMVKVAVRPS